MSFTSSLGKRARNIFAPTSEYEEGTWSPVLKYSTSTVTAATSTGYYVRVGNMVTVTAYYSWTGDITAGGAAGLFIDNMPFAARVDADVHLTSGCVSGHSRVSNASADEIALFFTVGTKTANFYWQYIASTTAPAVVQANQTSATGVKYFAFSFSYPTSGYTF